MVHSSSTLAPTAVVPPPSDVAAAGHASSSSTKVHVLESDPVCRYLFPYLLKMQRHIRATNETRLSLGQPPLDFPRMPVGVPTDGDGESEEADRDDEGLPFFPAIPETIVYEHNFPQAWYTYDVKTKELSKQSGKFLDVGEIFKKFSVVPPGCGDICAQFVGVYTTAVDDAGSCVGHAWESGTGSVSGGMGSPGAAVAAGGPSSGGRAFLQHDPGRASSPTADTDHSLVRITYFTPETLLAWLRDKDVSHSKEGILQTFVAPREERNDTLQMLWSPAVSTLTRRANRAPLNSTHHAAPHERCGTFDAPPHRVDETPGNDSVRQHLAAALDIVAHYLLRAEHKLVSRMMVHVKRDHAGRLWLLYATSIRVENAEVIGSCVVRDPLDLHRGYYQEPSLCPNASIDRSLASSDAPTVTQEARWKQFNTVHHVALDRQSTDEATTTTPRTIARRDTQVMLRKAERWLANAPAEVAATSGGGAPLLGRTHGGHRLGGTPAEVAQLAAFVDDTIYTIYAARMTTSREAGRVDVAIHVPRNLVRFLDSHGVEQLMTRVFSMEPVTTAAAASAAAPTSGTLGAEKTGCPTSYRLRSESAKKPLHILRNECDVFIRQVSGMYNPEAQS